MCGMRTDAVVFEHPFGISMVGRDEADASLLPYRLDDPAEAGIGCFDCFHHGRDHSCVADHVGVREVDHRECVAVADLLDEAIRKLVRGHLRLVVIARDVPRRGNEQARLARELVLAAPVEEVGDVRVLLGLRHVELPDAVLGECLCENHVDGLLRERDRKVEVLPVLRHRRQVGFELAQLLAQLARPVGPEVEEDRGVLGRVERRAALPPQRDDELVGDGRGIALLDTRDGCVCSRAPSL